MGIEMKQLEDETIRFREVLGNYPTGVTVVTTLDAVGEPVGLTVNSFASVSLDPLLILWSIDHQSSSLEAFQSTESFAVHILASDQADLCKLFASRGLDRFSQCDWTLSANQLPILSGVAGVLQCKVFNRIEAGDHTLLIGKVIDIEKTEKDPLLYHRGKMTALPGNVYN